MWWPVTSREMVMRKYTEESDDTKVMRAEMIDLIAECEKQGFPYSAITETGLDSAPHYHIDATWYRRDATEKGA
jgi:hypothetical protein